ncbi:hypothetical protein [Mycolicibacter heraklionensis]|nr:hypothetical protein [Mycolicibacter heraklionensis]
MATQHTQVVGVHAGALEVLADDVSVGVKAALSGPVENLSFALSH